jgi:hypothetical protein
MTKAERISAALRACSEIETELLAASETDEPVDVLANLASVENVLLEDVRHQVRALTVLWESILHRRVKQAGAR